MALLFFDALLLFGSWGTYVHLPVLHFHIQSTGEFIIFLYPPHSLSHFGTSLALPLQSHVHCRATATTVTLCLNHCGQECPSGHIHSTSECIWQFCFLIFLQVNFGVQRLPERSTPQWKQGVVSALYVLQGRVLITCYFFSGDTQELFY